MPAATKEPEAEAAPPPPPGYVELAAAGDATPPVANPLILNNAYFELGGANLRCTVKHLEAGFPENKLVTATTLCGEIDYPGVTKWHLRVTFHQDFTTGSVFQTLTTAVQNFQASGQPVNWKARPNASLVASQNNPTFSGFAIPQPFMPMGGDAGAASEVVIDWNMTGAYSTDYGAVAATGAVAGAPGYYTPSGANVPANLAGLSGVVASPATTWAAGQFVITADLLAAYWNGTTWVAGKHP
jgi:hypothetical protein